MNKWRAKDRVNLSITVEGIRRVWDRYLAGMKYRLVLGDELALDYRWIDELERILLAHDYLSKDEIRKAHMMIDAKWVPEFDLPTEDFKH